MTPTIPPDPYRPTPGSSPVRDAVVRALHEAAVRENTGGRATPRTLDPDGLVYEHFAVTADAVLDALGRAIEDREEARARAAATGPNPPGWLGGTWHVTGLHTVATGLDGSTPPARVTVWFGDEAEAAARRELYELTDRLNRDVPVSAHVAAPRVSRAQRLRWVLTGALLTVAAFAAARALWGDQ